MKNQLEKRTVNFGKAVFRLSKVFLGILMAGPRYAYPCKVK